MNVRIQTKYGCIDYLISEHAGCLELELLCGSKLNQLKLGFGRRHLKCNCFALVC